MIMASLMTGGPWTRHHTAAVHLAGRASAVSIGESHDTPHASHKTPVQPTQVRVARLVFAADEPPLGHATATVAVTLPATTSPGASPCRGPPTQLLRSPSAA
jgi:hypothetical protein